ncbi:hypothetical protein ACFW4Q_31855 [Streptomyces rochei]|uniref:hypothetical protein n=1 Tax=Streptomyces rochei TaxID=1928 RepID=UPI00369D768E
MVAFRPSSITISTASTAASLRLRNNRIHVLAAALPPSASRWVRRTARRYAYNGTSPVRASTSNASPTSHSRLPAGTSPARQD